jgi:hypothetical protein
MHEMLRSTLRLLALTLLLSAGVMNTSPEAGVVTVRFSEGLTRGFLVLRSGPGGTVLALGDLLQVARGTAIESRMVFHFTDGSLYDETVVYSQHRVFSLSSYHLIQRGPSFPEELDVLVERAKGQYRVRTRRGGKDDVATGAIDLPPDVYNGMIVMIVKNLAKGASEIVHLLAFTPKPTLIELELTPVGEQAITAGGRSLKATHYMLKPKLGAVRGAVATLIGKAPADLHVLIGGGDVPAFVTADGPLFAAGPSWRIETVSPQAPTFRPTP